MTAAWGSPASRRLSTTVDAYLLPVTSMKPIPQLNVRLISDVLIRPCANVTQTLSGDRILTNGSIGGGNQWCIGGYMPYTNLWVFLTAYTHLSPFATPVCVYPPPFLARHRWIYRHHNEIITPDAQVVESTR